MKQGIGLQELAREIQRQTEVKRDFIAWPSKLWMNYNTFNNDFWLDIPINDHAESYGLNDVSHSQISQYTSIPMTYYNRMRAEHGDLLTTNVNAWFRKTAAKPERRLIRTLDNKARAFLSDRYAAWIDNSLALTASFPVFEKYPGIEFKSLALTEKRLYMQIVLPQIQGEVKKGGIVYAGVVISNSEVGCGMFTVERVLYILACENGAIRGNPIGRRHLSRRIEGEDVDGFYKRNTLQAEAMSFQLMVRDHIEAALDEVNFRYDLKLIETAGIKEISGDIPLVVEEVSKRTGLIESESKAVLDRLIRGGDLSLWGMSQAITNLANETEDYDRVVELERIGGKIIDMPASEWTAINAVKA